MAVPRMSFACPHGDEVKRKEEQVRRNVRALPRWSDVVRIVLGVSVLVNKNSSDGSNQTLDTHRLHTTFNDVENVINF